MKWGVGPVLNLLLWAVLLGAGLTQGQMGDAMFHATGAGSQP
jgi:hypothetical protein